MCLAPIKESYRMYVSRQFSLVLSWKSGKAERFAHLTVEDVMEILPSILFSVFAYHLGVVLSFFLAVHCTMFLTRVQKYTYISSRTIRLKLTAYVHLIIFNLCILVKDKFLYIRIQCIHYLVSMIHHCFINVNIIEWLNLLIIGITISRK